MGFIGDLKNISKGPKAPFTAIYDQDYFSGSQCSIYIGDVWVDEVTSLSYSVSQGKTPIYGYASQLFDDVAPGQVLVRGNFTINYKEQGYLWAVLRRYKVLEQDNLLTAPVKNKLLHEKEKEKLEVGTRTPSQGPVINRSKTVGLGTIEQLLEGNLTKNDIYKRLQGFAGYATFDTGSPEDKVFEDIMTEFTDQVWADNITEPSFESQVRRTDANEFDDFDIYVVMGNYTNDYSNHTAQKITGVHLISQGKEIVVGGAPIQESYEFIARTVI